MRHLRTVNLALIFHVGRFNGTTARPFVFGLTLISFLMRVHLVPRTRFQLVA